MKFLSVFLLIYCPGIFNSSTEYNYPVPPKTRELLFYIQRNHNSNTIIYESNFDKHGYLVKDEPIKVYWIRYDEDGQRKELTYIQKWYAYGVRAKLIDENLYKLELTAYNGKQITLKQTKPWEAKVYLKIDNRQSLLSHIWVEADNSGVWPKVEYIELFGFDTITNEPTYEKYYNK